jgi:hypothetical protein
MTTDSGRQHPNVTLAVHALSALAFSLSFAVASGLLVLSAAVVLAIPGRRAGAARKAAPEASVA